MKVSIFLTLFSLFFCQNIITSWNYDKVAMYDIQKINSFLLSEFGGKTFQLNNTISWNNIVITNLRLIDIQTSLYDSYLNYNNGLFLLSPNKVTLFFNFSYSESTLGYNDTATLELKIGTFKIKISNNKTTQETKFSSKMSSPMENYVVPGIKDKQFYAKLQDSLFSGFQLQSILSRTLPEKIDEGLLNYYKQIYSRKKEFKIQTSEYFGKKTISMNNNKYFYFCEDLLGEYKNNFCYYSADEGEIKDKTKVPLVNERFSHNNESLFNIFINKDLIDQILKNTKAYFNLDPKIFDKKKNNNLSYDFNAGLLKKYFNGLNQFKDNEKFICEIYTDYISFNKVNYRIKFNINKSYFILNVTAYNDMDISLEKNVRINLCLKNSKTANIDVISNSNESKVEIINLESLKKIINEFFNFSSDKICLTDEGISMKDYFAKIKNTYIREEGIYLEGNHLYQ